MKLVVSRVSSEGLTSFYLARGRPRTFGTTTTRGIEGRMAAGGFRRRTLAIEGSGKSEPEEVVVKRLGTCRLFGNLDIHNRMHDQA